MIQANEIRVGNWVNRCPSNNPSEDLQGQIEHILPEMWGDEILTGIPITPEILEACGFVFIDRKIDFGISGFYPNKYWFIPDGEVKLRNGNYPVYKHGFCIGSYKKKKPFYYQSYRHETIGTELKYVHELQNLYFALKHEELSINLAAKIIPVIPQFPND